MLGGIQPFFIFTLEPDDGSTLDGSFNGLAKDIVSKTGGLISGVPIPIYLDEQLTGVWIDSGDDKSLNFDVINETVKDLNNKDQVLARSKGVQSDVTINLAAKSTSLFTVALLALGEQCFQKALSKKYSISYFNGATTIMGALMQSFVVHAVPNSEELKIQIVLSKKFDKQKDTNPIADKIPLPIDAVRGGGLNA